MSNFSKDIMGKVKDINNFFKILQEHIDDVKSDDPDCFQKLANNFKIITDIDQQVKSLFDSQMKNLSLIQEETNIIKSELEKIMNQVNDDNLASTNVHKI